MTRPDQQPALEMDECLRGLERAIIERDRRLAQLAASSPLRSKGRAVEDVNHLPLFVAANEPTFL